VYDTFFQIVAKFQKFEIAKRKEYFAITFGPQRFAEAIYNKVI